MTTIVRIFRKKRKAIMGQFIKEIIQMANKTHKRSFSIISKHRKGLSITHKHLLYVLQIGEI